MSVCIGDFVFQENCILVTRKINLDLPHLLHDKNIKNVTSHKQTVLLAIYDHATCNDILSVQDA